MELAAGLRASVRIVVGDADTAIEAGSGDLPVLATPRLLALAEAACVSAVGDYLAPGATSVGTAAAMEHRRPSPLGAGVEIEAELTGVDGRRLAFSFIARHVPPEGTDGTDEDLTVGAGTLERVVVDRAKFLARLAGPAG
jgi:fluoroacetyl-CoA thioesterase